MSENGLTPKDYKILALNSINYVETLLKRLKNHLQGHSREEFTDLEINDLLEILGFEDYELEQLLEQDF